MERTPEIPLANGARDLSKAEPFRLGPLAVDPPSRRIGDGARSEMLEPRVMRVLVALGETPGKVLSRDDLIELCWDALIVSDKAITRATSLLRHALEDMSGGTVRLETIPRVGFRLLVNGPQSNGIASGGLSPRVEAHSRWTRRAAATGLVAAGGAAVIGYTGWFRPKQHVLDPRAVELYRRGQAIQKAGIFESMGEALDAYKQAVAIDPGYADAWGALALSYRYYAPMRMSDQQLPLAAARRALALDPGNADAQMALILLYPYFRRWLERETRLRGFLRDHPDSAFGHIRLGWLMFNVGRLDDAVNLAQRAIDLDATRQSGWLLLAHAGYFAGRNEDGDRAIDEARSRWPQDFHLYVNGYYFLLGSNRYNEALAYLRETSHRPRILRPEAVDILMRQTDALATGRGLTELKNTMLTKPQPASLQIETLELGAPLMALLGLVDELFALYEACFFGGIINGTTVPPPGPMDGRSAATLFGPALAGLRSDPRYASLLERTGLEDYWRKSGTRPDFRRV